MSRLIWLLLVLTTACAPYANGEFATMIPKSWFESKPDTREYYPETAAQIAEDLDAQLSTRLGLGTSTSRGLQWLVVTTPTDVNAMGQATPLARAMAEELAQAMTKKGYYVQEIRKTCEVVFNKQQGEFMLSRDVHELATRHFQGTLVMTGTYVPSPYGVRFNIEVLDARNNDVLAKSGYVLPMSRTVAYLQGGDNQMVKPSVATVPHSGAQGSTDAPPDWRTTRMILPDFLQP
jgi:hypothetical protein